MINKPYRPSTFLGDGEISNKLKTHELYASGKFGNRIQVYEGLSHFLRNVKGDKRYGLRYTDPKGGGAWFKTEMLYMEAVQTYCRWVLEGAKEEFIKIYDSLPHDKLLIQGEIRRSEHYYDLTYTTETGQPNRPSMWKHKQTTFGIQAKLLLEYYMWPKSFANLMEIFDKFPEAVIEFSVVNCEIGVIPGHNTIFWEVREC